MTDTMVDVGAARAVDAVKTYGKGDTVVHALAGVTVTFPKQRFTAIMGPSGSGKSTLMQCVAGLDRLTSGEAYIGETALSTLNKTDLTLLRRDRLGFIFQQYNLIPTLSAEENMVLPLTLAGKEPDKAWFDQIVDDRRAWATGSRTCRASCRAASSSASRWPGPSCRSPRSCSPTSRPARSTRAPASRSSRSCNERSTTPARRS